MKIKTLINGLYQENCYILIKNKSAIIIDPGSDANKVINEIKDYDLKFILITHNHLDHVSCLKDILKNKNVKVYSRNNLKEKKYNFDNFDFEVVYTPGHTSDSISFIFDNIMFSGDFIFKGTIGRCDLGGNEKEMKLSLEKIKKFPLNLYLYPGHGDKTTLKDELENNPYL